MAEVFKVLLENLPALVSAVGVIIVGWFTYNQRSKDAKTEAQIKNLEQESEARKKSDNDTTQMITGYLWGILASCRADRVYIIQPHPLDKYKFLSVVFEVCSNGTTPIKPQIQSLPIDEVKTFAEALEKNEFILYRNDLFDVEDARARALLVTNGCATTAIRRLTDIRGRWNGSILCGYLDRTNFNADQEQTLQNELAKKATLIQYLLPPYEEGVNN